MDLIPLQKSAEFDEVEAEFKALFLRLYEKHLADKVREVALYGMPHLGTDEFISRELNNDGLAILHDTTNEKVRYLFHAWRYRNPQRGTAFLETYLRALFGNVYTIEQLWCPVAGVYPADSKTEQELQLAGISKDDCFLTSRFRIDLETEIIPERILEAAKTAVAARFVLELRAVRRALIELPLAMVGYGMTVVRASGAAKFHQPKVHSTVRTGPAVTSAGVTLVFGSIDRLDMQTLYK